MAEPDWCVLLIGGGSGVGKTQVAHKLARDYGISALMVDDLRLAIQEVTTSDLLPDLHTFVNGNESVLDTPERVRDGLIAVARAMIPAVRMVIAHHIAESGLPPVIIEGDALLPELTLPETFASLPHFDSDRVSGAVRAVFVHEADVYNVWHGSVERGRGLQELPDEAQHTLTRGAWLYGEWLRGQAQARGLQVIPARPHDTLAARVRALLKG